MNIQNHKRGLQFAIPISLFIIGFVLIALSLIIVLRPYWWVSRLFLINPSAQRPDTSSFSSVSGLTGNGKVKYSEYGAVMGSLTIKSAGIENYPVYHGDNDDQLREGIGQFTGSDYPGEGGKIVLDAHRETYFKNLGRVKIGDTVDFTVSYGKFLYRVYSIKILKENDISIINPDNSHEFLVMYTCYPFDTPGYHPRRYVVYASRLAN